MSVPPRHALWAMGFTGLLVGGSAAIFWHLFVSTRYEETNRGVAARAFETSERFYEPAPAWLPTTVALPVVSTLIFSIAALAALRGKPTRSLTRGKLAILSVLSGVAVGMVTVMWAMISPPSYVQLTQTRPLRIALTGELDLWLVLPGLCAATSLSCFAVWMLIRRLAPVPR